MDEFDLDRLTGFDFERLCQDLFEDELGTPLEIFPSGPDEGIDLRSLKNGQLLVIQCKHWTRAGRAKLISHYRKVESRKVHELKPDRYIIACTAEITIDAKRTLIQLLDPYLKSESDIHGIDQIVGLLSRKPHIVERHLRLWLGSSATLIRTLNRDVARRSRSLMRSIDSALKIFVPNRSFFDADQILQREHVCIISGNPGVGKSTLAKVLAAKCVKAKYSLIDASNSLGDIDKVWQDDAPQVFLVDDFLGRTSLDPSRADAASRALIELINDVRACENKRLILTTRNYILQQAREKEEVLRFGNFQPIQFLLRVGDFTRAERVRILYNHVYFSGLSSVQKRQFAARDSCERVVDHSNYSPRIIEHALDAAVRSGENVIASLLGNLTNPTRIWEHLVEEVFDEEETASAVVLFSFDGAASIASFEEAWHSYLEKKPSPRSTHNFNRLLKRLVGTIFRLRSGRNLVVEFHDPSVIDYMTFYVAGRPEVLSQTLRSAATTGQLLNLFRLMPKATKRDTSPWTYETSGEMVSAVSRLRGSGQLSPPGSAWIESLTLMITVADTTRDKQALLLACEMLDSVRSWSRKTDADKLVRISLQLNWAKASPLRQRIGLVLIEALREIRAEATDWDSRRSMLTLTRDLGKLMPDELEEQLVEECRDEAESILSDWADLEGDPDFDFDEFEVEEAIKWLESEGDTLPGLDEAKTYLDELGRRHALQAGPPKSAAEYSSRSFDSPTRTTIEEDLFSALRSLE